MDRDKTAAAVESLLKALGEDPSRAGLARTPSRVAEALEEMLGGYDQDPLEIIQPLPGESSTGLILVRDVDVVSFCEHHLLPFIGKAAVAYLPGEDGRICGLSKLARLIDALSRRLQVQERLVAQAADALEEALEPRGVFVMVDAEHLCMTIRGAKKPGTRMVTMQARGVFEDPAERAALLQLIQGV